MDIALNQDTWDIELAQGDLRTVDALDAITQHVAIGLQFFRGEWLLDQRIGIPYYQNILIKNPDFNLVRFLLREAVLQTPGVTGLTSFTTTFTPAPRSLGVQFEGQTTDGPLVFDRELVLA